jgi:hypothetical protein
VRLLAARRPPHDRRRLAASALLFSFLGLVGFLRHAAAGVSCRTDASARSSSRV